jgi:4-hydroxybenzoate polyprenyltransferase
VLPGILVGLTVAPATAWLGIAPRVLLGLLAVGLIASSNYVLNEVLDARYDAVHPVKRHRPVPSGRANLRLAIAQWIGLLAAGVGLGRVISRPFAITMIVLWLLGTLYNLPPFRTKDVPYLDVLTEALTNPTRMVAGWLLVGLPVSLIPVSLLVAYWMVGCYFMGVKRYAELRELQDRIALQGYRKVFGFYTEPRLLVSIVFYASAAMLFLGAFIIRYRMELILAFPLVALVMAIYLTLAFRPDSAVQAPEKLYREPILMLSVVVCAAAMIALLFVDIPRLHDIFAPTLPISP